MAEPIAKSQMVRRTGTTDDLVHHINRAITDQFPLHKHVVTTLVGYSRDDADDMATLFRTKGWKVSLTCYGVELTPVMRLE